MTEIPMKLIKDHTLLWRLGHKVICVDIGILSGPTYFDHVLFCMKTHTDRDSVARARVQYYARVRPGNMKLHWEAHAGAVPQEWGEFKTLWRGLKLLLRHKSRRDHDEKQSRNENKHTVCSLSQFSASPILTLTQ